MIDAGASDNADNCFTWQQQRAGSYLILLFSIDVTRPSPIHFWHFDEIELQSCSMPFDFGPLKTAAEKCCVAHLAARRPQMREVHT